jgi:hypothetical protein
MLRRDRGERLQQQIEAPSGTRRPTATSHRVFAGWRRREGAGRPDWDHPTAVPFVREGRESAAAGVCAVSDAP